MKINFLKTNRFTCYYKHSGKLDTEETVKNLFKTLGKRLRNIYRYEFKGYYEVEILRHKNIIILDFCQIEDEGRPDFNVMIKNNCIMLYEFKEHDYIKGIKIFYKGKFYVELGTVYDKIDAFEHGRIVFGKEVDKILSKGKLIT